MKWLCRQTEERVNGLPVVEYHNYPQTVGERHAFEAQGWKVVDKELCYAWRVPYPLRTKRREEDGF